jgi:hypothetical protein
MLQGAAVFFPSSNDVDGVQIIDRIGNSVTGYVNLYGLKKS